LQSAVAEHSFNQDHRIRLQDSFQQKPVTWIASSGKRSKLRCIHLISTEKISCPSASHGNRYYVNSKKGDTHRPHNSTISSYTKLHHATVRPRTISAILHFPLPSPPPHSEPSSTHSLPQHWSHQSRVRRTSRINTTAPACSYHTSHFSL